MLGMPRIEIEFEFDMVFYFGIRLAPYAVFSTRIYLQRVAFFVVPRIHAGDAEN